MDIPALSMALSQQSVMSDVGTAVLAKSMDTSEDIGAAMISMMEQSVMPNLGQNVNISL